MGQPGVTSIAVPPPPLDAHAAAFNFQHLGGDVAALPYRALHPREGAPTPFACWYEQWHLPAHMRFT